MDIVLYVLRIKKKIVKKPEIWIKFFSLGCVFYPVEDWDDLQIDPHLSLYVGFKIQYDPTRLSLTTLRFTDRLTKK